MDTYSWMSKGSKRRSKQAYNWHLWEDRDVEDVATPTARLKELQNEPALEELD